MLLATDTSTVDVVSWWSSSWLGSIRSRCFAASRVSQIIHMNNPGMLYKALSVNS